ncbi:MAG: PRD domain-containing protein [Angelakisella sp.]|jgi:transcriptional antiterminator|nr:PRD domain-containing protein [Angelakisella sp.]
MIQLTSRQQALLRFLAAMSGYVSVKDIANQFGYSQRTIRYDLDAVEVWLRDQGGALDKRPNAGVRLEAGAALRRRLEDTLAVGELEKVFSPEERMEAIYYRLLLGEGPVKAEDLAEGLGVSTPTVMRDIREMGQWMEDKQLTVASKKGEGYRLAGREQQLRSCLVQALAEGLGSRRALTRYSLTSRAVERLPRKGQSVAALAARYLSRVDMDALSHLLDYARETLYHTMPENDYIRLLLYLAVLCRRAGAGAVIPLDDAPAGPGREGQLAALLTGRLGPRLQIKLGEGETANLARWLISCNVKFPPKTDDKLAEQLSSIVDEMLEVLHSYPSYDMPDFYRDKLKMNLLAHLRLTIKKYQLQIPSPNPLLVQMKVNYPEIFTVVYRMADLFHRRTGIPLDEDEIGFIAIHIAANVEECNRLRSKRALIVCNTGQGAARVLQSRIRNNIPRLEIRGTLSALDAENMDALSDVDFVISTVALPQLEKPVFQVSPIISAAEIDRISRYLNGHLAIPDPRQLAQDQQSRQVVLERLAEKYVPRGERERFLGELAAILPMAGGAAPRQMGEMTEENIMFQCAMILAKVGEAVSGLQEEWGIQVSTGKLLGLVIHILMSIPRWRKGGSNREYASEQYKNDNIEVYDYLVRQLRDVSEEYGIPIPDKEALAFMRYFI